MVSLLDVNSLVAMAWPNHVHHRAVRAWFKEYESRGWATCPLTESGFVLPVLLQHHCHPKFTGSLKSGFHCRSSKPWG